MAGRKTWRYGRESCVNSMPFPSASPGSLAGLVIQPCFHSEASTNLSIKCSDLWAPLTHTPHTYLHSHLPGHIKYAWLYFMRLEEARVTPASSRESKQTRGCKGSVIKLLPSRVPRGRARATAGSQHPLYAQAPSLPISTMPRGHSSDPAGAMFPWHCQRVASLSPL